DRIPGNHLRTLMRQRLSEITGLSGEMLQQVAQSTPPTPKSSVSNEPPTDYGYYFDAQPDYGDVADYADHIEPPAAVYEQQKPWQKGESKDWKKKGEWKKGGDWKKGRNDAPPRKPVHVESPTLTALRTLLHHPQLAQKVEDVSHFADEEDTYAQLLVALVGTLQKSPRLRSLQLIARWHGTEQGRLLRALAEKEWLIEGDNLEKQFFDTITTLTQGQLKKHRDQLLRSVMHKSPSELSDEEKALLREHFSHVPPTDSKSPTGA
ncbi:MAG TPA: DNA primase, partial [Pseudomonas sp.]|nr:DNA primase [Pseudomonas sp.]